MSGRRRSARGAGPGRRSMIVLGLTGGIAMGKSTAASIFRSFDVPVHDADAEVHRLLGPAGAAVATVDAAFPGCLDAAGGIDRAKLGRAVLGRPEALRRLEGIIHPLVRAAQLRFLAGWRARRCRLAVLDIPLLFETGAERRLDKVATVSAPGFVQAQRVLRRASMTAEKLEAIRARQTSDPEKRRRADFVIPTGLGRRPAVEAIGRIVTQLRPPEHCARAQAARNVVAHQEDRAQAARRAVASGSACHA